MAVPFECKSRYTMEDLLRIMELLRAPGGCPWDREQTHHSIRSNLLEETYEAIEAIDNRNMDDLKEELGDVLMQVVFHAQMEKEAGSFTFDDVVDGVCQKLVVRHPHVFGDVTASDSAQVLQNWDAIKRRTKGNKTQTDLLRSVPRALPALMRAEKVQGRARRVGFDWPEVSGAMQALRGETEELQRAIDAKADDAVTEELGDVLFSAVNVARFMKVDPEEALTQATDKFIRRFAVVERLASERGMDLAALSLDQLDALWDEAKRELAGDPPAQGSTAEKAD